MSRKEKASRVDIYDRITDRIVAELEKGVRPWMQPWHFTKAGRVTRPLRYNSLPYSGMNVLLLWSEAIARGFASPMWMTFKQALELGGAVRKGETGSTVVFASRFTRTQADASGQEEGREIPFLKAYSVFNTAQIEGLPDHYYGQQPEPVGDQVPHIEHCNRFFANTGAVIRHGGDRAYFSPATDHIQMPPLQTFRDAAAYVATLSHEATHWTSAPHRVNRDLSRYGKDRSERAREELIAELGSCFLCADLGIAPELEPRPDHASYLGSWLSVLADDKRAIFSAAAHAQRAVAFLHGLQPAAPEGREAA
jgi:antirestriction protein ArdC